MPRKLNPIWSKFDCIKTKNSGLWARCKKCKKEMQGILSRMEKHYKTCCEPSSCETQSSGHLLYMPSSFQVAPQPSCSQHHANSGFRATDQPQIKQTKMKLTTNKNAEVIITTREYAERVDKQIGRYFYATNTPFTHAEHPQFKSLCSVLRPGYKAPSRNQIENRILEKVFTETLEECKEKIKNKTVCMALHGWSDVHNEPLVCCNIITPKGDSFLVDTIDTGANKHTSTNFNDVVLNSIKNAEKKFPVCIKSYVTDNVANVAKMRRELSQGEVDILYYGCSAHILNMLAQDLEIPAITSSIIQVIKYFRNKHIPWALYKQAGGKMLVVPQEMTWNTMNDAIKSYLDNRRILVQICQDHKSEIEGHIIKIVNDSQVTINAVDFIKRVSPIAVALNRMQRKSSTIAVAVEIWHKLQLDFDDQPLNVKKCFNKRKAMALYGAHYAANMIDHRFLGKNLSNAEKKEGFEYINETDKNFVPFVMALLNKSEPFPEYVFGSHFKNTSPLLWWASVALENECLWPQKEKFHAFCEQLLTATASTAALERQFSSFGLIQSKLRNQLVNEKAAKLAFMFQYFNQDSEKRREDWSWVAGGDELTEKESTQAEPGDKET